MPLEAGAESGSQDQQNAPPQPSPGWTTEGMEWGYEYNPETGETRRIPSQTPGGRAQKAYEDSLYGRLGSAYGKEQEALEAFKERERERFEQTYQEQMGYAQRAVGGQAAGGSAAMLRGGASAIGQQARYGETQHAAGLAAQDMYFQILEQELLARGASYEEIAQAVADAQYSLKMGREASDAEAKAAADAAKAAEAERVAGMVLGVIGSGATAAGGSERIVKRDIAPACGADEDETLAALQGYQYRYKPGADTPHETRGGDRYGPMVDELGGTELGRSMVTDDGRGIDYGSAQLAVLPLLGRLHERLSALERQGARTDEEAAASGGTRAMRRAP